MPTYQYRCKDCGDELEIVQKFTDDALTECPACEEGELRKVFNAVGVVFKGSGFYRTDSRSPGKDTPATTSENPAKSDTGSAGSADPGGNSSSSSDSSGAAPTSSPSAGAPAAAGSGSR